MDRLTQQLTRLYLLPVSPSTRAEDAMPIALPAEGDTVRAAILGIRRPVDWKALAAIWQGIQDDFGFPAPAIAVNGSDALCLWFSFEHPVRTIDAAQWLDAMRLRYLPGVDTARVIQWPNGKGAGSCRMVPAPGPHAGQWSAFVTPGMVSLFADEPWLEQPPNPDAQADLLSTMRSIPAQDFIDALGRVQQKLTAAPQAIQKSIGDTPRGTQGDGRDIEGSIASLDAATKARLRVDDSTWTDPRAFLLAVMNDPAVPLALRLDAAKSLLPTAISPD